MRRILLTAAAAALAVAPASALMIANFSTAQKAVQADAIVVGKVSEIEKDEVEVLPFPGAAEKVKMRVGVIKIETGLVGAKNVTHVKVLFAPPAGDAPAVQPLPGGPAVRPLPIRRPGFAAVALKEGDEGLYFLTKHPTAASYYHIQPVSAPVSAKADNYKAEVAKVTAILATLADPMTALKAEKIEDRLAAASVLVQKYRRGLAVPAKEVAVPAEQTKAILKTLADADWTAGANPKPGQVVDFQAQPAAVAGQLGLFVGSPQIPQFQVKPGEDFNVKYAEAFKAWYAKSGDKFEIKQFVPKD